MIIIYFSLQYISLNKDLLFLEAKLKKRLMIYKFNFEQRNDNLLILVCTIISNC